MQGLRLVHLRESCGKKDRCLGMRPSFGEGGKGRLRPCIRASCFSPAWRLAQRLRLSEKARGRLLPTITSFIQAEFFRWQGFDGGTLQKLPIGRDASSLCGSLHIRGKSLRMNPPLPIRVSSPGSAPDREAFANPDPPTD